MRSGTSCIFHFSLVHMFPIKKILKTNFSSVFSSQVFGNSFVNPFNWFTHESETCQVCILFLQFLPFIQDFLINCSEYSLNIKTKKVVLELLWELKSQCFTCIF